MATSAGRRSLFWRVNTATAYTMLAGAVAWAAADAVGRAVGDESAFRSITGGLLFVALFLAIGFVVSMVTYGALLRHYTVSPAPDDKHAEPGAAADTAAR